jgi:hypothetical protein
VGAFQDEIKTELNDVAFMIEALAAANATCADREAIARKLANGLR